MVGPLGGSVSQGGQLCSCGGASLSSQPNAAPGWQARTFEREREIGGGKLWKIAFLWAFPVETFAAASLQCPWPGFPELPEACPPEKHSMHCFLDLLLHLSPAHLLVLKITGFSQFAYMSFGLVIFLDAIGANRWADGWPPRCSLPLAGWIGAGLRFGGGDPRRTGVVLQRAVLGLGARSRAAPAAADQLLAAAGSAGRRGGRLRPTRLLTSRLRRW